MNHTDYSYNSNSNFNSQPNYNSQPNNNSRTEYNYQPNYNSGSNYDGSFVYKSAEFKQKFSVKVLTTVGAQILATIAICIFNFRIMNNFGTSYINFMIPFSLFGAVCCLLATCSR